MLKEGDVDLADDADVEQADLLTTVADETETLLDDAMYDVEGTVDTTAFKEAGLALGEACQEFMN